MSGIIIYKSACGSTEEYARWIADATGYTAVPVKEAGKLDLTKYDTIIAGSLIIAGRMAMGKWLTKRWEKIKDKKVVLFSTSGEKPDDSVKERFLTATLSPAIAERVSYFPLHGRRRQADLKGMAKFMMWVAVKFIAKTPEEKEEMSRDFDGVARENLEPLLAAVKG